MIVPSSTPLPVELPSELSWLDADVRALQRSVMWASSQRELVTLSPGGTRLSDPDLPADSEWSKNCTAEHFNCHHADGPSMVLQLNMADIPAQVRRPEWPRVGVLWVFFESARVNVVTTQFDPRPAEAIPWKPRTTRPVQKLVWHDGVSLPFRTETILPCLWHWDEVGACYDDWVLKNYRDSRGAAVEIGGWCFTNQGDFDEDSAENVLALRDLYFGDCGEVYVFFNPERGFYGRADIC